MFKYRVLKEIIKFGDCKRIESIFPTLDSIKKIFKKDLTMIDVLNEFSNSYYSQFINIFEHIQNTKEEEDKDNEQIRETFKTIFKELVANKIIFYYSSPVNLSIVKDKDYYIDIYEILNLIDGEGVINNCKIICENEKDYCLSKLQLLNICYASEHIDPVFNDLNKIIDSVLTLERIAFKGFDKLLLITDTITNKDLSDIGENCFMSN